MTEGDILIIQIILLVILYLGISTWLIIYNFRINKKFSIMSLIPFLRFYLLGKLLVHKIVGIVFMILTFILFGVWTSLGGKTVTTETQTIFGTFYKHEVIPHDDFFLIFGALFLIYELILLILLIVKFYRKKSLIKRSNSI